MTNEENYYNRVNTVAIDAIIDVENGNYSSVKEAIYADFDVYDLILTPYECLLYSKYTNEIDKHISISDYDNFQDFIDDAALTVLRLDALDFAARHLKQKNS